LTNKVLVRLFVSMRLKYLVNPYLCKRAPEKSGALFIFNKLFL
jgi:hypothetical protein